MWEELSCKNLKKEEKLSDISNVGYGIESEAMLIRLTNTLAKKIKEGDLPCAPELSRMGR